MASIIQWNCRGIRPNLEELQLLIQNKNPMAICLQETKLNNKNCVSIKNYSSYFKNLTSEVAHGGVMILVSNSTPHSEITLVTELQAVAVRITSHRPISLCSVYLPPNMPISLRDLENLVQQLPAPVLLLGDGKTPSYAIADDSKLRSYRSE